MTDITDMEPEELAAKAEEALLLYVAYTKPLLATLEAAPCRLAPSEKLDVALAFDAHKAYGMYRAELKDRQSSVH